MTASKNVGSKSLFTFKCLKSWQSIVVINFSPSLRTMCFLVLLFSPTSTRRRTASAREGKSRCSARQESRLFNTDAPRRISKRSVIACAFIFFLLISAKTPGDYVITVHLYVSYENYTYFARFIFYRRVQGLVSQEFRTSSTTIRRGTFMRNIMNIMMYQKIKRANEWFLL